MMMEHATEHATVTHVPEGVSAEMLKLAEVEEAHLPGIKAEICGTWVWVTGSTKPVKDSLKAMGFHWAPRKRAWYWHAGKYRRRHRTEFSMNEIRFMHGSTAWGDDDD